MVVCGSEEHELHENRFSPMEGCTPAKIVHIFIPTTMVGV